MLRKLNEQDMEESIQIRCAIEGFCIHMAASQTNTKKGQKLLVTLERLLDKQEKALGSRNGPSRGVPVWNGLTNEDHPTQMLADLLTIREHLGCLKGLKLVYMGDARYNMGNSLMIACTKMGMHFVACAPR